MAGFETVSGPIEGRAVVRFESDGSRTVFADSFDGERLNSPNDLSIDPKGTNRVVDAVGVPVN